MSAELICRLIMFAIIRRRQQTSAVFDLALFMSKSTNEIHRLWAHMMWGPSALPVGCSIVTELHIVASVSPFTGQLLS